jgi:hypothetical protein
MLQLPLVAYFSADSFKLCVFHGDQIEENKYRLTREYGAL